MFKTKNIKNAYIFGHKQNTRFELDGFNDLTRIFQQKKNKRIVGSFESANIQLINCMDFCIRAVIINETSNLCHVPFNRYWKNIQIEPYLLLA